MPPAASKHKCSQLTAQGKPCKAWAVEGTEPPACAAHTGRTVGAGAPPGNANRATHGFYSAALQAEELADLVTYADDLSLDDEIACARVALRRILALLNTVPINRPPLKEPDLTTPTPDEYAKLAALAFQGTRTVAKLLRDKRALSGESADGIAGAIAQALDELATEWGIDL